jgi:hypothetical protein
MIQGWEGEIKSLCSRIEQLEGEIEELKALDDEELKKLAKMEEVQVLHANMYVLERQLDFERGQWTELQGKYKELMDRFFVLDHWEGVSLANAIQKKLDKHLDEQFHQRVSMEVTKRVSNIMKDPELQKKLVYINVDEEYNNRVSKEAIKRFKDMEECLILSGDPNPKTTPLWLNWAFNSVSREKCLREARKAMAIYMALSSEGSENIRCSLAFFDKANGGKIVPPVPITCWGDGSAMFEGLYHKNNGQAKIVKWEFEVEEGWLPYKSLSSHLIASEKEFVHPREMAKCLESGYWCQVCFDHLGLEGAFQLRSCGHLFHVGCIQQSALHCMECSQCRALLPRRFYELIGIQVEMPIGFEFNEWNLPLDQEPHRFMNFTQWGDKVTWDRTLKRPQMITSLEWDPMSWMTSDNEVEIRAQSMEDEAEHEVLCRNFGGHWDKNTIDSSAFLKSVSIFQKKSMKGWPGWDRGHISKLVSKYDTMPIERAKFLLALKEAAIQYVELEKNNAADENDDIVENRDADLRRMNSMDAFLSRMKSTIIQWRTYLASLNGDTLVLSNAKVDEFVAMVEHARKIHRKGETNDRPTRKRKREEEEADSDHSPTFKHEMERVDENMRRTPPRASQRMETRAQVATRRLEFELANLNAHVVHEIGESSSAAIMEISDSE